MIKNIDTIADGVSSLLGQADDMFTGILSARGTPVGRVSLAGIGDLEYAYINGEAATTINTLTSSKVPTLEMASIINSMLLAESSGGSGGNSGNDGTRGGTDNPNVTREVSESKMVTVTYTNPSGTKAVFKEQTPKDISTSIEQNLKSTDIGKQTEGEVGKFVQENTSAEVTAFGQKIKTPTKDTLGDIDVATDKYIVEVKNSASAIKKGQVDKFVNSENDNFFNYENKKVIVFIKEQIKNSRQMANVERAKTEGARVIIGDLEELKRVLEGEIK